MRADEPVAESGSLISPPDPALPISQEDIDINVALKNPGVFPGELLPWKKHWWEVSNIGMTQDRRFCVLLVLKDRLKKKT